MQERKRSGRHTLAKSEENPAGKSAKDLALSSLEWIALAMDAARRHQEAKQGEPCPDDGAHSRELRRADPR